MTGGVPELAEIVPSSPSADRKPTQTPCHIYVYGKFQDPVFQQYRVAAEYLASEYKGVEATVQALFETQYEQLLQHIKFKYGSSFERSKPSSALVYAETSDALLYFLNEKRFFDWALKRFRYEDHTRLPLYKHVGNKALRAHREATGRSYCALGFSIGDDMDVEVVRFELFDDECPLLARNFLKLMEKGQFKNHLVHRVKAGAWIQAGDLVDSSGLHSEAADGGYIRHESFGVKHDRAGLLGMANQGKDTNGSQFYITLKELPFLDGRSVIFGRVIGGMRNILRVGRVPTVNERPVPDVRISACAEAAEVGGGRDAGKAGSGPDAS